MCSSNDEQPINILDFLKSCYRVSLDTNNEYLFSGRQNCSGELIQFLLDILHNSKKKNEFKYTFESLEQCKTDKDKIIFESEKSLKQHFTKNSWIIDEFNITLSEKTCCSSCNYTRIVFNPQFILLLTIPDIEDCSIEDCLDYYTKKEIFEENDEWRCDKCQNEKLNYR